MSNRIAVAISGGGRTLANLIARQSEFGYQVGAVIASSPTCAGLKYAREADLPVLAMDFTASDESALIAELAPWLKDLDIELICLAGFLKKFPILSGWKNRIINIHPARLPKFGGKGMYGNRVHAAVIDAKESTSGATIHFVNEVYDDGQIIAQTQVAVLENDSSESLAERVFDTECEIYPKVVDGLITGKLPLANDQILEVKH